MSFRTPSSKKLAAAKGHGCVRTSSKRKDAGRSYALVRTHKPQCQDGGVFHGRLIMIELPWPVRADDYKGCRPHGLGAELLVDKTIKFMVCNNNTLFYNSPERCPLVKLASLRPATRQNFPTPRPPRAAEGWCLKIHVGEGWAIYITGLCRNGDNPETNRRAGNGGRV